jgi:hypothetical protein
MGPIVIHDGNGRAAENAEAWDKTSRAKVEGVLVRAGEDRTGIR